MHLKCSPGEAFFFLKRELSAYRDELRAADFFSQIKCQITIDHVVQNCATNKLRSNPEIFGDLTVVLVMVYQNNFIVFINSDEHG